MSDVVAPPGNRDAAGAGTMCGRRWRREVPRGISRKARDAFGGDDAIALEQ